MKKVTGLNGKEYNVVGTIATYGEIFETNGKYYYFSRGAGRMMPIAKSKVLEVA